MKITLSGYGKMGREIEKTALQNNHSIAVILDNPADWNSNLHNISGSDVIIDFTQPDAIQNNILQAFKLNIPMVVGTTGWNHLKAEIRRICQANNHALFVASNFNIGVNIFYEINSLLAGYMNQYDEYSIQIEETHHTQKLDKPSGTAIELANQIIDQIQRKQKWVLDETDDDADLPIVSNRIENIPGTHQVTYSSDIDQIEIVHKAKSRRGFAIGALTAAEWIIGKKGYFGMKDLLETN
jgi:4-hydroxy-tetrahydrodipicolinate reductase